MRNEGITDKPVPPWQLPGAIRRDCEPHRGPLLRRLGVLAVWLDLLGVLFPPAVLPALPLGVAVWVMARRDLAGMRLGLVDPGGEADTRQARRDAICGVILPFLTGPVVALGWFVAWLAGLLHCPL
jgi:hypothetical protein